MDLLSVQYDYFTFLFHVHSDSIVHSRRPVAVPVQCRHPKPWPPHCSPLNLKSQNGHWSCRWQLQSGVPSDPILHRVPSTMPSHICDTGISVGRVYREPREEIMSGRISPASTSTMSSHVSGEIIRALQAERTAEAVEFVAERDRMREASVWMLDHLVLSSFSAKELRGI